MKSPFVLLTFVFVLALLLKALLLPDSGVVYSDSQLRRSDFHPPVRLVGGGEPVRVESPGYAAPCLADIDSDGRKDLLVGQFNKGKIKVYKNIGDGTFAAGSWLQADGETAQVPGVW